MKALRLCWNAFTFAGISWKPRLVWVCLEVVILLQLLLILRAQ